ncbi:uncharacterized protein LOC125771091 [Anopheles funestus]|uniref:uncharacterized protein LOC125771091 n=1 Tax=Anopheles funestus TaxID=62324 RepID=UPI0020C5E260|nr:uncharacterized protein LOC125771091 [Anopheles funestus]
MSGFGVPFGNDLPPPLIPLPSCRARVKQLQARLFNEVPLATSYTASCRLCLSSNFGEKSTTIIEGQLCAMLRHVFPFPIKNQIGLPMNVCTDCYKSIHMFYVYSHQVRMNQQKLQETLVKVECMDYIDINNAQYPFPNREERERMFVSGDESQKNDEDEILIDTAVQCKQEDDEADHGQDPLLLFNDGTSLSLTTEIGTVQTARGSLGHQACNVDGKTNANGNVTNDRNAESSSLELRKKTQVSSVENGHKTLEQNTTDLTNRLGEKPLYICSICSETFDKQNLLTCHHKTHLMKECPICNQSIQYALLAKHVIQEHAERARREKK